WRISSAASSLGRASAARPRSCMHVARLSTLSAKAAWSPLNRRWRIFSAALYMGSASVLRPTELRQYATLFRLAATSAWSPGASPRAHLQRRLELRKRLDRTVQGLKATSHGVQALRDERMVALEEPLAHVQRRLELGHGFLRMPQQLQAVRRAVQASRDFRM